MDLRRSDSEESMSVRHRACSSEDGSGDGSEDDCCYYAPASWEPVKRKGRGSPSGDTYQKLSNSPVSRASRLKSGRCLRCEAYDAHCKSAAENYRRTLSGYTKTVSELMLGFKTVLERYPELRVDTGDERLHFMVQAALGRNNLVREMVRLAAKRGQERALAELSGVRSGGDVCSCARERSVVATVCEALKSCYSDGDALRMILERYADLYVRYMEVWRNMCAKISKDVSAMEFVELTRDRPGVSHDEPWGEANAYVARMLTKVASLVPRCVGEACARSLRTLSANISHAPQDFESRNRLLSNSLGDVRERLDDAGSKKWSWDSNMNDLYFDIRSDLAVLESLIGVGEISVKSLLYERSLLISQLRKLVRNEGASELRLNHALRALADAEGSMRRLKANTTLF